MATLAGGGGAEEAEKVVTPPSDVSCSGLVTITFAEYGVVTDTEDLLLLAVFSRLSEVLVGTSGVMEGGSS